MNIRIAFINTAAVCFIMCLFALPSGYSQTDEPTEPEKPQTEESTEPQATNRTNETEEVTNDTTVVSWNKKRFVIISDGEGKRIEVKDRNDDWYGNWDDDDNRSRSDVDLLALDLGITNYWVDGKYGADAAVDELEVRDFRPGSHVALHLLPTTVGIFEKGNLNLKTAITIDWSNYYYANDITLIEGPEGLQFDTTGVDFSKNKLTARYAQIPLMLNFDSRSKGCDDDKGGISFSIGGYAGILWKAWTKQVSEEEGKVKLDGRYNLNRFKYGLMARLDLRWFDIYVQYNLSEVFEEEKGPSTQTFMAGINVIDF